jgi:molybdate transport system substrate-binding protein
MWLTRPAGGALFALLPLLTLNAAPAAPLRIAAASDLQAALPSVARQFERQSGEHVSITFGSSGNFFTQIENGAPFDVFLSADGQYPARLAAAGRGEKDSLYRYAIGRIVLWTRNESKLDLNSGLAMLVDPAVRTIAIANPDHAPYGAAAVDALRHERLYDAVQAKIVRGENISQAAQFVQSGNADVGIIALALALSPELKRAGRFVQIPASLHHPIEQTAIVVSKSTQKEPARRFVQFLRSPDAVRTLASFGFELPRPGP